MKGAVKVLSYTSAELELAKAIFVELAARGLTNPSPLGFSARSNAELALATARVFYQRVFSEAQEERGASP